MVFFWQFSKRYTKARVTLKRLNYGYFKRKEYNTELLENLGRISLFISGSSAG